MHRQHNSMYIELGETILHQNLYGWGFVFYKKKIKKMVEWQVCTMFNNVVSTSMHHILS